MPSVPVEVRACSQSPAPHARLQGLQAGRWGPTGAQLPVWWPLVVVLRSRRTGVETLSPCATAPSLPKKSCPCSQDLPPPEG